MRVWLIDEFGHGGINRYVVDVSRLLEGASTTIIATTDDASCEDTGAAHEVWFPRRFGKYAGKAWAAAWGLLSVVSRPQSGDVVWVPLGIRPAYELTLVTLARIRGCRVVVTVHNRKPHARTHDSRAVQLACRLAADVVVHTKALERWAVERRVAPTRLPFPQPNLGRQARREGSVAPKVITVSLLGYQYAYKGPDILLRALARVKSPRIHVVLAGKPAPDLDLPQLAAELGVLSKVTLDLGFLEQARLAQLLDETDIIALPYRDIDNTGIGASARQRGLPAIASDLPALRELFGDTAIFVTPGDDEELGRVLSDLPATYPELARKAQSLATDHAGLSEAYHNFSSNWA